MAFVQFARGNTAQMNNTSITNGLLFFNTETKDLYIDDNSTRIRLTENTSKNLTNTLTTSSSDVLSCQGYENYILPSNEIATTVSEAMTTTNLKKGVTLNVVASLIGDTPFDGEYDYGVAGAIYNLSQPKILLWENKNFNTQSSFNAQTLSVDISSIDSEIIGLVVVFASQASYTSLETSLSSRVYPIRRSYNPNIYPRTITTSTSGNNLLISIDNERNGDNFKYIPVEIYGLVVTERL